MTVDTEQFRAKHAGMKERAALLRVAARAMPDLPVSERDVVRARLVAYLRDVVEPHMRLDERLLFPAVDARLGDQLATAPMAYEHLAIRWWIRELAETSLDDIERLQELMYGLDALIRCHVWKEDELYLTMLDSPSWPGGN